jgi:hypothetical protein
MCQSMDVGIEMTVYSATLMRPIFFALRGAIGCPQEVELGSGEPTPC